MKFLLLLLGIIFFFIFFLFSKLSISGSSLFANLFIEANIYMILSVIFIGTIFKTEITRFKHKKIIEESDSSISLSISKETIIYSIKIFFEKYLYYIASVFFYISLFILFQVFLGEINIPKIFLFFNIGVLFLHFLEKKFLLFQDFIRVNTIIVSLYYVFFHIGYLLGYTGAFLLEDILNIVLIFILFFFFFRASGGKKYIPTLCSYMVAFIFLELSVFAKYLAVEMSLAVSIISFLLGIIYLVYTDYISNALKISQSLVRIWGLIFSYIFIIFSVKLVIENTFEGILFFPFLGIIGVLLFLFHNRFQNYISLLFSGISLTLMFYQIYLFFTPEKYENIYLFAFLLAVSLFFIFIDKFYKVAYIYDVYFFHIFSIIVNLCGATLLFFFWDFSILRLALLLLGESLYFFFSYYTLRNISKKGLSTL